MKRSNGKPWNRGEEKVRYCRCFDGQWPGVSEWIEAEVSTWDDGWEARCSTGFPDEKRTQWNVWKVFPTRDEAAAFAAAFVIKSEELVAAILAGEPWTHPNAPMRDVLAHEIPLVAEVQTARAALDRARDDRDRRQARDALRSAEEAAELAWWRSHDWRDFQEPKPTTLAMEAEEDEHEHRRCPAA